MAEDYAAQKREAIHTVLEGQNAYVPAGSILTGWVVLAEWMSPEGRYELTCITSKDLPSWRRDGMLHTGLFAVGGEFNAATEKIEDDDD